MWKRARREKRRKSTLLGSRSAEPDIQLVRSTSRITRSNKAAFETLSRIHSSSDEEFSLAISQYCKRFHRSWRIYPVLLGEVLGVFAEEENVILASN